ncbi:hypothetical protein JTE90_006364 [Oedothorax gibbosus]|uniref:Poly(A)-specific ribonuclease PARN n=1 Tax=Oedothorax gibbosus TaxID=931172 RepID=A0AAV6VW76_9ARAC|nr:hypothetical protein JTE90_006364 [Oedothorax gibbosus]
MVDVTKSNFAEQFLNVKQAIDECDFLGIDTELTGLYNTRSTEHAFDTMEERYEKHREQCSNILIIQFGLSAFKYHPQEKKYTHRDFNFYVFPRPHMRQAPDPKFICQTSSFHFLASHGFDFNKVIYEGIPYLTHAQEEKLRDYLASKHKNERSSLSTPKQNQSTNGQKAVVPDEHKQFIEEINKRVDAFIADDTATVMQLEPCSAFRRKLIYETVQQKHTEGIEMTSKMNDDNLRFITILKCTEQDKLDKLQSKEMNDLDDVDTAVGFRKVMDYLSQSKKLIVGQCIYLDILHMIEQFYFPLPQDLKDYKTMVRMTFPNLLDTKYLASSERLRPFFERTSLSDLFKILQGKAFDLPEIEAEGICKCYDQNSEKYHEAGYDAFLAGVVFIGMAKKLGSMASPSVDHVGPSSKLLSPYVNRFHILRHYDITCLNLAGPDRNIYVHWLDDVSALVALKDISNSIKAKSGLVNKFSRVYKVKPYADFQKWEKQQLTSCSKEVVKKPFQSSEVKPQVTKRRNSGSEENSACCSMDLIPEDDENEAEPTDGSEVPPAKKLKPIEEGEENESGEVSSTAGIFEEDNNW